MKIPTQEQTIYQGSIFSHTHEGNIKPLCKGYYSNPQIYIFGATYIVSLVMAGLMISQVFIFGYHAYIGRTLCLYIMFRYLSLAFSDPGLARLGTVPVGENYRFCSKCQISVRKYTRHCEICDVCVEGYDHHCIFIGKCIGKNNYGHFKEFLCLIFGTMIYGIVISVTNVSNVQHVGGGK